MKRAVFLMMAALLVAAFQIISNCAQPLESSDLSPTPSPGPLGRVDTLFVYDTVLVIHGGRVDTVIVVDTIIQYDTTVITDTIIDVDTVVIPDSIIIDTVIIPDTTIVDTVFDTIILPDTTIVDTIVDTVILPDTTIIVDTVVIIEPGDGPMLCDRLSSAQQEIVWLFRNAEGPFHLEFAALPERDHPQHTLTVAIGDQIFFWDLSESLELVLDVTMPANATIIITTSRPPSFGHAIDICLTWTKM